MRPLARLALALSLGALLAGSASAATPVTADDLALGDPKAKITVIEYGSLACSHCAAWNADVWPAFKAKYVDSKKVRYVFREILTEPVQLAGAGAMLTRCASKTSMEKAFAVIDATFKAQEEVYATRQLKAPILKAAAAGGMDEARATACLTDEAVADAVNARIEGWSKADGIDQTPTFIINGKKLEGGHSLAELDAAIAAAGK